MNQNAIRSPVTCDLSAHAVLSAIESRKCNFGVLLLLLLFLKIFNNTAQIR
jgi:hypothetical protein